MLGITVANLTGGAGVQLELPFRRSSIELDAALDEVRERFGPSAIARGSLLGRDPGISAWLLPADGRREAIAPGRRWVGLRQRTRLKEEGMYIGIGAVIVIVLLIILLT